MKLFTALVVLFTALFFNPLAYSASNDQTTNYQTNFQQLANEIEDDDDDSEC